MKTQSELLQDIRDENMRLVRDNLRLRSQRAKLRKAFADYVKRTHLSVGQFHYRLRLAEKESA